MVSAPGCQAFLREGFPCVDGACPGPSPVSTNDAKAKVKVKAKAKAKVKRSSMCRSATARRTRSSYESGLRSNVTITDANSRLAVVGIQADVPSVLGECASAGAARGFFLARLSAGTAGCTVLFSARMPIDEFAFMQYVDASDDALAFVFSGGGNNLAFDGFPGQRGDVASVGVVRGGALTLTPLQGFAGDLTLAANAPVVVGSSNDSRPWFRVNGQSFSPAGEGTFEWTEAIGLDNGDVIVAGSGSGTIEGDGCVVDDNAFRAVIARLHGSTLTPLWVKGLCGEAGRSSNVDVLVVDEAAGLAHVLGYIEHDFVLDEITAPLPDGDSDMGFIASLALDDGEATPRPAPFGRFITAVLLSDGRLAISLVAARRSEQDGVEVNKAALVFTRP